MNGVRKSEGLMPHAWALRPSGGVQRSQIGQGLTVTRSSCSWELLDIPNVLEHLCSPDSGSKQLTGKHQHARWAVNRIHGHVRDDAMGGSG